MFEFLQFSATFTRDIAWPMALLLAWIIGEFAFRWTGLPRISVYGLVGFLLAQMPGGFFLMQNSSPLLLLANIAFGLILFEFGYRINIRWLRINPWIGVTGLLDSMLTFVVVYLLAIWYGSSTLVALLLAALAMSTSPAGVMRVINEQRSSGQVTERTLHMTAVNCVLAVFAFKVILGVWVFQSSGNVWQAVSSSLLVLMVSALLGALFGVAMPKLLRVLGNLAIDATLAFALSVIALVAIAHATHLSPVLAALTFGLVARHRRVTLNRTQRNFGVLGDLLYVFLFVFAVSTLEWRQIQSGLVLGGILVLARLLCKVGVSTALARVSGISWRKGALTGMALAPISVFVILLLEQTRYLGIELVHEVVALAAMTLILELFGPILTQRALKWARETPEQNEE